MSYTTTIDSVLPFGMTYWNGNVSKQNKSRLDKNIKKVDGEKSRKPKHSLSLTNDKQSGDNFG